MILTSLATCCINKPKYDKIHALIFLSIRRRHSKHGCRFAHTPDECSARSQNCKQYAATLIDTIVHRSRERLETYREPRNMPSPALPGLGRGSTQSNLHSKHATSKPILGTKSKCTTFMFYAAVINCSTVLSVWFYSDPVASPGGSA